MTMTNTGATPGSTTPPEWFPQITDPEIIGHLQNKGIDKLDPIAAISTLAKSHREAESKLGAPSDRLLRMPVEGDEPAVKAFWGRLGAPEKADDYTFDGIDFGDEALNASFLSAFRETAAKYHMPAAMAAEAARAAFKFMEDHGAAEDAAQAARLQAAKAELEQNWGAPESPRFQANMMIADQAAHSLGITKEEVVALGEVIGVARASEMFRTLGVKLGEDRFIANPAGAGGSRGIMSREQAIERRFQLMGIDGNGHMNGKGDSVWRDKYMKGDAEARKEFLDLTNIITGG